MRTLEEVKAELDEIIKHRQELSQQLTDSYKLFERLNTEYYNLKYSFEPSLEAICAIEDWDKIPSNLYKKFTKYLKSQHSYVYPDGYNPETGQLTFTITQYSNHGIDYSKIEHLLTLIRPNSSDKKYIGITDSACSAHGVWMLVSDSNGTSIEKTVYGRTSIVKKFLFVGDALNWIYANLFVKDDKDED